MHDSEVVRRGKATCSTHLQSGEHAAAGGCVGGPKQGQLLVLQLRQALGAQQHLPLLGGVWPGHVIIPAALLLRERLQQWAGSNNVLCGAAGQAVHLHIICCMCGAWLGQVIIRAALLLRERLQQQTGPSSRLHVCWTCCASDSYLLDVLQRLPLLRGVSGTHYLGLVLWICLSSSFWLLLSRLCWQDHRFWEETERAGGGWEGPLTCRRWVHSCRSLSRAAAAAAAQLVHADQQAWHCCSPGKENCRGRAGEACLQALGALLLLDLQLLLLLAHQVVDGHQGGLLVARQPHVRLHAQLTRKWPAVS